ncbi:hypothetical protein BGZ96_003636 [Linnemannia gamsii]|uniref:Uncharacterized protein n=1 Tax=Linnemannia gamsii TaxID=64522 RepID=A0ABQ7KF82_9FUNG|nr:hypothetical protein BGZ96_003636 [Linnemannia gamsii]
MASLPPDKNKTSSLPLLRRTRSSSKSPSPYTASATTTTTPTDASSGISHTTSTTPTKPVNNKKKRVRKTVVKTTPRYISESDHEAELIPPPELNPELAPEPEIEAELSGIPGSATADNVAKEEPAEDMTTFLNERAEDPHHLDTVKPIAVVIPESSMLKAKLATPISSSPASSRRAKQTSTHSSRVPESKNTPRRRRLKEPEPETEEESAIDAEMGPATRGEKSEAAEIKEMHQPVGRHLVLGDEDDEEEVESELLETPDWTFEEPAKEAVVAIKGPSPGASPVRSLKQNQQKQPQGRRRSDLEANADDVIDNRATSLRPSTGKAALTQTPSPPVLETSIFVGGVGTTNRLLSKGKTPSRSRPKSTQPQNQPSIVSRKPLPNPHAKSGTEENMVASPQKKALVRSPVLAEETRTYRQSFGFCEKKPYRLVDYVHVYDWMSPAAPLRVANNDVQQRIDKLNNELESADQNQENSPMLNAKTGSARITSHYSSIKEEIRSLRSGHHPVPPTIAQSRCHWCGIKITDDCPDTIEEQFVGDQVQIKDVGSLPSAYQFDHEQKRLCKACTYECGVLLKAKRKYQLLYELSVRIQPPGCVNCGIRESDRFRPDTGYVGLLCSVCDTHKKQNGLDLEIPKDQMRFEKLMESIVGHSVDGAIRWDRIANDSRANPNFEYSAHGLLHRWVQHQRKSDQPSMSTYILLQHNHFIRRSSHSQLYTCRASTPTKAALYFSRFVALYKKQPMSYIFIRKLETWNIPASRGDEWEDQSSGLQTFEDLKQRIRKSVLEESPKQMTKTEIRELYDKVFPSNQEQTLKTFRSSFHDEWEDRLFGLLSEVLGQENRHLVQQLHFDHEAWNQYLLEWFVPRRFFAEVINKLKTSSPSVVVEEDLASAERSAVDVDKEGFDDRTLDNMIEEKQRLVRSSTGLGFVPLDPPEPRFKQLPEWAQKRARKVHRQAIQDERLNRIHQRHLFYESVGRSKPKDALGFDLNTSLEDAAATLFAFCTNRGLERSLEDCTELVRKARERGGVVEIGSSKDSRLRKIFVQKIVEIEKQEHTNGARAALPSAHDPTPMPSAQLPTHSVPAESQVHVYQAVLTAEARTVDVRLVRTERYKLQGDSLAGGGPIQIPKIINREALRGFYREADRAERYAPVVNNMSEEMSDTTIVLRSDKGGCDSGLSGVETWKMIDLDTMIRLEVAEPIATSALPGGGVKVWRNRAELMAKKPEVLKQRREKMCEVTGLPREDVQILHKGLYRVSREVLNAASESSAVTSDVDEVMRRKRLRSENVEEMDEDVTDDIGSEEGSSQDSGVGSAASRTSTSPRPHKRPRSSSLKDRVQAAEEEVEDKEKDGEETGEEEVEKEAGNEEKVESEEEESE